MNLAAAIVTALVAVEHFYFMILEMFLWQTPTGLETFQNTAERARDSAVLAANQGLYNGFLAAGLVFSLVHPDGKRRPVRSFFLGCVAVAGIYGGLTAFPRIFFIQAVPALIALALVWLQRAKPQSAA